MTEKLATRNKFAIIINLFRAGTGTIVGTIEQVISTVSTLYILIVVTSAQDSLVREVFPNVFVFFLAFIAIGFPATVYIGKFFFSRKSSLWATDERNRLIASPYSVALYRYLEWDARRNGNPELADHIAELMEFKK